MSWPKEKSKEIDIPYSQVFYDWVLLMPINPEEEDSEIEIPREYNDKWDTGIVLLTGPGKILESGERVEMPVEQYDVVRFEGYSARKESYKGNDFLLIRQEDLRGKYVE